MGGMQVEGMVQGMFVVCFEEARWRRTISIGSFGNICL